MKLRAKLLVVFSIGILLLFVQAGIVRYFVGQMQDAAHQLADVAKSRQLMNFIDDSTLGMRSSLGLAIEGSDAVAQVETVKVYKSDFDIQFNKLIAISKSLFADDRQISELKDSYDAFLEEYKAFESAGSDIDSISEQSLYLDDVLLSFAESLSVYNKVIDEKISALIQQEEAIRGKPTTYSTVVAVVAALVLLGFAWVISGYLVSVIRTLANRAASIAEGDLSGETLTVKGSDELSELTHAINRMSSSLRKIINNISDAFDELDDSLVTFTVITTESNEYVRLSSENISECLKAIIALGDDSKKITSRSNESVSSTQAALLEAQEGLSHVRNNSENVQELEAVIREAEIKVQALSDGTAKIQSILNVINDISEQTNLLALNAAIEAARAGEMGRGFAVVADEVRTLASRTLSSADEIKMMIESLRKNADEVVRIVGLSTKQSNVATQAASQAQESLSTFMDTIEVVGEHSADISSIVVIQEEATNNLSQQLQQIQLQQEKKIASTVKVNEETTKLKGLSRRIEILIHDFKC